MIENRTTEIVALRERVAQMSEYLHLDARRTELAKLEANAAKPGFWDDQALAQKTLTITEVSQGGSVPQLLAVNSGDLPILIVDGEELAGAKQNRILNASVLLAPKSETVIPVSCTEQGRWAYASREFDESEVVADRQECKVYLRAGAEFEAYQAGWTTRYIGSYQECSNNNPSDLYYNTGTGGLCYQGDPYFTDPTTGIGFTQQYKRTVSEYYLHDLNVSYALKTPAGKTNLALGVQNVFDSRPPRVYSSFLSYADYEYQFPGRTFFARVTQNF